VPGFPVYITRILLPTPSPGDIVVCDNLSSHKIAGVAEAIQEAGACLRYLPPYSPDLNPIEMAFAKLKAHLRRQSARQFPQLLQALIETLETFEPNQCRNFLKHSQYATN
jgi:transposase